MRRTLEAFYFGNIRPNERDIGSNSRCWKISKKAQQAYEELSGALNEKERKMLENYMVLQTSAQTEFELDAFITGFRSGVRLLVDSMVDNDFETDDEIELPTPK